MLEYLQGSCEGNGRASNQEKKVYVVAWSQSSCNKDVPWPFLSLQLYAISIRDAKEARSSDPNTLTTRLVLFDSNSSCLTKVDTKAQKLTWILNSFLACWDYRGGRRLRLFMYPGLGGNNRPHFFFRGLSLWIGFTWRRDECAPVHKLCWPNGLLKKFHIGWSALEVAWEHGLSLTRQIQVPPPQYLHRKRSALS